MKVTAGIKTERGDKKNKGNRGIGIIVGNNKERFRNHVKNTHLYKTKIIQNTSDWPRQHSC